MPLVNVAPDIALADLEGSVVDFSRVETIQNIGASAYATISRSKYSMYSITIFTSYRLKKG